MFGKLIKHEFKATRKNFSVLFAAMLLVTLLIKPLFWIQKGMISDDIPFSVLNLQSSGSSSWSWGCS